MRTTSQLQFRTLDDSPCGKDAFDGPHRKVAEALIELLTTYQVGGQLIGLEGSYGGGKTNVVRMVARSLAMRPEWRCIVFDPSTHKDDPQRRSFLETVIDSLASESEQSWLPTLRDDDGRTKWDREKLQLANKVREDRTTTIPKPTFAARLYAGSLLAMALSAPFVPNVKDWPEVFKFAGFGTYISFAIGLLLLFSPVLVFILDRLGLVPRNKDVGLVFNDSVTETTTTSSTTPDQTSIEFVDIFRRLMSDVLELGAKRRLLIVIDNLDRLDAQDARSIWSSLQIFVSAQNSEDAWVDHVTFLVPYDAGGLTRIWSMSPNAESSYESVAPVGADTSNSASMSNEAAAITLSDLDRRAESYLDKSFVHRLRVPPIVASDWRSFLRDKLEEAFSGVPRDGWDDTVAVFSIWRRELRRSYTPREIIHIVNQMGATFIQWRDDALLPAIAYFTLLLRDRVNVAHELRVGSVPSPAMKSLLGADSVPRLAGLVFNVEPSIGQQILIENDVRDALHTADSDELDSLRSSFGAGFESVFRDYCDNEACSADLGELLEAAIGVDSVKWDDHLTRRFAKSLAGRFAESFRLPLLSSEIGAGVAASLRIVDTDEFTTTALQKLRLRLSVPVKGEDARDLQGELQAVVLMLKTLEEQGRLHVVDEPLAFRVSDHEWLACCDMLHELSPSPTYWSLIKPKSKVGLREIEELVVSTIQDKSLSSVHRIAVRISTTTFDSATWQNIVDHLDKTLAAGETLSAAFLVEVVELILELRSLKSPGIEQVLSDAHTEVLHWLGTHPSDERLVTRLMLLVLLSNPLVECGTHLGASESGVSVANNFL